MMRMVNGRCENDCVDETLAAVKRAVLDARPVALTAHERAAGESPMRAGWVTTGQIYEAYLLEPKEFPECHVTVRRFRDWLALANEQGLVEGVLVSRGRGGRTTWWRLCAPAVEAFEGVGARDVASS